MFSSLYPFMLHFLNNLNLHESVWISSIVCAFLYIIWLFFGKILFEWHQISVIFHVHAYFDRVWQCKVALYTFVHLLRQNASELYSGCALCCITNDFGRQGKETSQGNGEIKVRWAHSRNWGKGRDSENTLPSFGAIKRTMVELFFKTGKILLSIK